MNANSGNSTAFDNSANSYGSDLNITDPNGNELPPQSNTVSNYSDSVLQRSRLTNTNKNSTNTLHNRIRASAYEPDGIYNKGINNIDSYNTKNNSMLYKSNFGINANENFGSNNISNGNGNFSFINKLNKLLKMRKK